MSQIKELAKIKSDFSCLENLPWTQWSESTQPEYRDRHLVPAGDQVLSVYTLCPVMRPFRLRCSFLSLFSRSFAEIYIASSVYDPARHLAPRGLWLWLMV